MAVFPPQDVWDRKLPAVMLLLDVVHRRLLPYCNVNGNSSSGRGGGAGSLPLNSGSSSSSGINHAVAQLLRCMDEALKGLMYNDERDARPLTLSLFNECKEQQLWAQQHQQTFALSVSRLKLELAQQ